MLALSALSYAPPTKESVPVHPDRVAHIAEINAAPGVTWKAAAHPRFAGEAPGASKNLLGVKGNWQVDIAEGIKRGEIERYVPKANAAVPDDWDAAEAFPKCAKTIGDIRDQSACGCCWAFGGAEAASDRMCIASDAKLLIPLSAQDICFNSNFDGCDGGQISTPWNFIKRAGVVSGGQNKGDGPFGSGFCSAFSLPHCHHHGPTKGDPYPAENTPSCPSARSPRGPKSCDSDAASPHDDYKSDKYSFSGKVSSASGADAIKQFLMEGGPCEVAFTVYTDFENYDSGIYKHVSGSFAGGHAVKMVGWGVENGQEYWKIANSWNPYWGEKGYFRIAPGEGGIDAECIGSSADSTWSKASELIKAEPTFEASINRKHLVNMDANGHYGDPKDGCASDEISVRITGIAGDVCTPPCSGTSCPTDVPSGVTATPLCALKDPTGKQYCILECTPSVENVHGQDGACGTATCKPIQGVGVCTYDD